jgi:peptidoglycan/xylan/chitin deacetylase (PgdA/CDA1 family)
MNRLPRLFIKLAALSWRRPGLGSPHGVWFLIYHKTGGQLPLDIDLPVPLLRRQLAFLAQTGRVVAYERALELLANGCPPDDDLYVLTFDDGYQDFYDRVFPLLTGFGLPAILFVTTGFVEDDCSPLTDSQHAVEAVTWEMLGEMQASGLVTVGAHAHSHRTLVGLLPDGVTEELVQSMALFRKRLGQVPEHFAYPRGLWDEEVERQVKGMYRSAVIGGGEKAVASEFDRYRIPRIPIRRSDGWFFFQAKVRGWLAAEERVYSALHRLP